jgi:hypothetical protein
MPDQCAFGTVGFREHHREHRVAAVDESLSQLGGRHFLLGRRIVLRRRAELFFDQRPALNVELILLLDICNFYLVRFYFLHFDVRNHRQVLPVLDLIKPAALHFFLLYLLQHKMSRQPDPRAVHALMEWATEQYDFPRVMAARRRLTEPLFLDELDSEEWHRLMGEATGDNTLLQLTSLGPNRARKLALHGGRIHPPITDDFLIELRTRRVEDIAKASRKRLARYITENPNATDSEMHEQAFFFQTELPNRNRRKILHSVVDDEHLNEIIDKQHSEYHWGYRKYFDLRKKYMYTTLDSILSPRDDN